MVEEGTRGRGRGTRHSGCTGGSPECATAPRAAGKASRAGALHAAHRHRDLQDEQEEGRQGLREPTAVQIISTPSHPSFSPFFDFVSVVSVKGLMGLGDQWGTKSSLQWTGCLQRENVLNDCIIIFSLAPLQAQKPFLMHRYIFANTNLSMALARFKIEDYSPSRL